MKDALRSQLDTYKRDNTQSSKKEMLSTINSISNTLSNKDFTALNSIEEAKRALTDNTSNKGEIVQTIESVISTLS